jgi:uncharacterized RDD family membrane protein YckC
VAPSEDDARFFLLSFIPQGLLLGEVRDGRVGFDAFHPNASATHLSTIWAHFLLAGTAYLMVPVFFAFLTSGMMAQWRTNAYRYGTLTAEFAAMWRRAVAEVADLILVFGPMFAGIVDSVWIMVDPRRNLAGHHFLRRPDLWIFRGMAWSLLAALLFSWLEGRWGVTPGKALAGIRILGTDLQFCGFPRALLRNLLRVVDGLFNFMVGILVTALSENWQRVGDMAARTVVVRARSSGFDAPSDEPVPGESAAG